MGGSPPQTVHSTTKVTPMQCWWVVEVTFLCGMVLLNLLYSSVAVIGSTSPIMDMVQDLGLKLQCTKHTWHYKIRQHFSGHSVQKFLRVMSVHCSKKMAHLLRLSMRASCWRGAARLRPCSNTTQQTEGIVRKEGEEMGIERVTPDELVGWTSGGFIMVHWWTDSYNAAL